MLIWVQPQNERKSPCWSNSRVTVKIKSECLISSRATIFVLHGLILYRLFRHLSWSLVSWEVGSFLYQKASSSLKVKGSENLCSRSPETSPSFRCESSGGLLGLLAFFSPHEPLLDGKFEPARTKAGNRQLFVSVRHVSLISCVGFSSFFFNQKYRVGLLFFFICRSEKLGQKKK